MDSRSAGGLTLLRSARSFESQKLRTRLRVRKEHELPAAESSIAVGDFVARRRQLESSQRKRSRRSGGAAAQRQHYATSQQHQQHRRLLWCYIDNSPPYVVRNN